MTTLLARTAVDHQETVASPARRGRTAGALLWASAPGIAVASWLHFRTDRPLTMDESFTVLTSGRSWWSLVRGCTTDVHMSVYYVVLKAWSLVAGTSIEHLRWFSLLSFAALVLGVGFIAVSRRRPMFGMLAGIGLAVTPMFREATIDARAAAFASALAVWLVVLFDEWLGDVAWPRRRVAGLLAGSVAASLAHPSTLFVGVAGAALVWRFARRENDRELRRGAIAALVVIAGSGLVAAVQSGAVDTVARAGFDGPSQVLSELPGGHLLAGVALLATIGVLLAGRAYDGERIVRWFAGAALMWFALAAIAFPLQSVFVPRYFVAAAGLLVLALILAPLDDWSRPIITVTVALVVVGGAARLDRDYGFGSEWCTVADELAASVEAGHAIALGSSAYASPIVACLGDRGVELFARATTNPALSRTDLADPRALWMSAPPDSDQLLTYGFGQTAWFVWVPGTDRSVDAAVRELQGAGAACRSERFGSLSVASCQNG